MRQSLNTRWTACAVTALGAAKLVACSVIIAARNAEKFLPETLRSLANQTFDDFEVIVVDDGSTDGTAALAQGEKSYPISLLTGPAKGVSAARNFGLKHAKGAWIVFLDADDLLVENGLARFAQTLSENPKAVCALAGIARIAEDGSALPSDDNRDLARVDDPMAVLLRKNFIVNGAALAIRRDALAQSGGFDETLTYGEDWELWCRILSLGPMVIVEGDRLVAYRQVGSGANYKAREDAFARNVACLDRIAVNPTLRAQYGRSLDKAMRARRIDVFWSGVRSELQFGTKWRAVLLGLGGLCLYPDTALRPSLAMRFVRSMRRSK